MRSWFKVAATLAAFVCAFALAACGGDDSSSSGSGSESTGATKGAKTLDASAMDGAKGNVTYCTGKDTSGISRRA